MTDFTPNEEHAVWAGALAAGQYLDSIGVSMKPDMTQEQYYLFCLCVVANYTAHLHNAEAKSLAGAPA